MSSSLVASSDMGMGMRIGLVKKLLFSAMKGNWEEVVHIYKEHPEIYDAKITISGETALHIAVSEGRERVVEELLQVIMRNTERNEARSALKASNERGNTPLHLAAVLGSIKMCRDIAEVASDLVHRRNHDGETPLFLAVLHGWKEAFLFLVSICGRQEIYSWSRRNDGETILHCAIAAEHFDLANQIIDLSDDRLVNSVNEAGNSPLHILAAKPLVFRSGSNITGFQRLVYNCISVDELEQRPLLPERFKYIPNCLQVIEKLSKAVLSVILLVFSFGSREIARIKETKQKQVWSVQVLDKLLERTSSYEFEDNGRNPQFLPPFNDEETAAPYFVHDLGDVTSSPMPDHSNEIKTSPFGDKRRELPTRTTAVLIAAKNGVMEVVAEILKRFPVAIYDMDSEGKNIVLLAAEYRQRHVYQLLLDMKIMKDTTFRKIDDDGNTVLHLAAKLGDYRPWLYQDAALHLQREINWFEYVKNSMPVRSFSRFNNRNQTPEDIFVESHKALVLTGAEWLIHAAESCSFVGTIVATVAFATSTTIPGSVKQDVGTPTLEKEPGLYVFAISSLLALCFSVTSVVTFLTILTSGFQIKDFHTSIPRKLLMGLTTLCLSITFMLISFCASHFFIVKDKLRDGALPIYAVASLPVIMTLYAIAKFPHCADLMRATFSKFPVMPQSQPSYELLLP